MRNETNDPVLEVARYLDAMKEICRLAREMDAEPATGGPHTAGVTVEDVVHDHSFTSRDYRCGESMLSVDVDDPNDLALYFSDTINPTSREELRDLARLLNYPAVQQLLSLPALPAPEPEASERSRQPEQNDPALAIARYLDATEAIARLAREMDEETPADEPREGDWVIYRVGEVEIGIEQRVGGPMMTLHLPFDTDGFTTGQATAALLDLSRLLNDILVRRALGLDAPPPAPAPAQSWPEVESPVEW